MVAQNDRHDNAAIQELALHELLSMEKLANDRVVV